MRIFFGSQAVLTRDHTGTLRSLSHDTRYAAWKPYRQVFSEVVVLARVAEGVSNGGDPVEGPGVRVVEVPYFSGAAGIIRSLPRLLRFFTSTINDDRAVYAARIPNVLGMLLQHRARILHAPFLGLVVGDLYGVLRSGAAGQIGKALAPISRVVTRWYVRRADALHYVTARELQRTYPPSKSALVLSGTDAEIELEDIAAAPRDYTTNPPHDPVVLLTVGSQNQMYKGHDVLIDAVASLTHAGVRVRAHVVGTGKYHTALSERARAAGLINQVVFEGHRTRREIRDLLEGTDIFVLPSLTEGMPRALLEAMSMGVMCIATSVGGIPELIDDEYLVPPSDARRLSSAIRKALESPLDMTVATSKQWLRAAEVRRNAAAGHVFEDFLAQIRPLVRSRSGGRR